MSQFSLNHSLTGVVACKSQSSATPSRLQDMHKVKKVLGAQYGVSTFSYLSERKEEPRRGPVNLYPLPYRVPSDNQQSGGITGHGGRPCFGPYRLLPIISLKKKNKIK